VTSAFDVNQDCISNFLHAPIMSLNDVLHTSPPKKRISTGGRVTEVFVLEMSLRSGCIIHT